MMLKVIATILECSYRTSFARNIIHLPLGGSFLVFAVVIVTTPVVNQGYEA